MEYRFVSEAVAFGSSSDKKAALAELSHVFADAYDVDQASVEESLNRREELGSTGFGRGIAIPHARIEGLKRPVAAFLKLAAPIDFQAADTMPVELVFGLLSPVNCGAAHLHALAAISRSLRDEEWRQALVDAPDLASLRALLIEVTSRDAA